MVKCAIYNLKQFLLKQWIFFLQSSKQQSAYTQNANSERLNAFFGRRSLFYAVREDGKIVGAGRYSLRPLRKQHFVAEAVFGPVLDYTDTELVTFYFEQLKRALKQKKVIYVAILPNIEMGLRDEDGAIQAAADWDWLQSVEKTGFKHLKVTHPGVGGVPRWLFEKSLQDITDDKQLEQSFTSKTRNMLTKARKNGVYVREATSEDLPQFEKIMDSTGERRGFETRESGYYETFLDVFGSEDAMVVMAFINPKQTIHQQHTLQEQLQAQITTLETRLEANQGNKKKQLNQIKELQSQLKSTEKIINQMHTLDTGEEEIAISGALFVTFNDEMTYLYSGTLAKYFDLHGSHMIQKYAQSKAVSKGLKQYNYLGTVGSYCDEDDGIHQFKKGFGGRVVELPGAFTYVVHPLLGRLYRWKNEPH